MKRKQTITIKDIASELNISVATVSRAMRDTHDVNQSTRQKVLDKMKELNYKINYNARGLANQKTNNIGVIIPHINSYYFSTVITGIQNVAYAQGYNVVLFITEDSIEREISIINSLSLSSLDGLIVCVTHELICTYLNDVVNYGVPIVFFDSLAESIVTSKVRQNDFEGAYIATKHLIDCGYKKIAHITSEDDSPMVKARTDGYLKALADSSIEHNPALIKRSDLTIDSGSEDTLQLLKDSVFDGVFAINDRKAIGAIIALKQKNIQVGKEIGVVGFTDDPIAKIISPSLTTIHEPAFEIGQVSGGLLLKHIYKKNFIPENITLSCKLVVRESTQR